ncbi:MAG: hypothetical protein JO210_17505 [Acidobacteriaceae bacterium]|nr:hypothetical protein [Acidobacteriaceae bacterium]
MSLRPNQKLTHVLAGRTLERIEPAPDGFQLHWADGSLMHIKSSQPPPAFSSEAARSPATVARVRQQDTKLVLEFQAERPPLEIETAEPTASVLLRTAQGALEYAD